MNDEPKQNITTRRAIEVVMSRLNMTLQTRDDLQRHLFAVIDRDPGVPENDVDELRAVLRSIQSMVEGTETFPKAAMVTRLQIVGEAATKVLCRAIPESSPETPHVKGLRFHSMGFAWGTVGALYDYRIEPEENGRFSLFRDGMFIGPKTGYATYRAAETAANPLSTEIGTTS